MFKRILMPTIVLGALAATVGAGSLSAFTGTAQTSGDVTAATADLSAWDGTQWTDPATITFSPTYLTPDNNADAPTSLKNSGNAALGGVTDSSTILVDGGHPAGCASYLTVTSLGLPPSLAVGATTGSQGSVIVRAHLDATTPDVCQGAVFTVTTTFSAQTP